MIPFSFTYLAPETLEEAVQAYENCGRKGQAALYYAGGTEIITMGRVASRRFDALIDLKRIPAMGGLAVEGNRFILGAARTLNDVSCWDAFPLLSKCCQRVADHTAQCKITLGGNLLGTVIYRETALALLLGGSTAALFGPRGFREAPLETLTGPRPALKPGEFLVHITLDKGIASLPYVHVKHVEREKTGYPLFTLAAVRQGNTMRAAVSGLYPHPVWADFPLKASSQPLIGRLQGSDWGQPLDDLMGSRAYRMFRLEQSLRTAQTTLTGGNQ